jgi:site-specific recombinase XerD
MAFKSENPYIKDFLIHLEMERGLSKGTIEGYRIDLSVFSQFLDESGITTKTDFSEIKQAHIRKYLYYLKTKRNNTNKTIARKITALKTFFLYLKKSAESPVKINPMEEFDTIKFPKKLPQYMTLEEAKEFLEAAKESKYYCVRNYAMFLLALQTGIRVSELINLKIEDYNFENSTIRVMGKGQKERIIPLTQNTIEAIKNYLKERTEYHYYDYIFITRNGTPISKRGMKNLFDNVLKRTSMKGRKLSMHKLRHTCMTLLLKEGVDIRIIKEIAGHESIATTQIYTHVVGEDIRKGMEKHPLQ